jgi:hypothetical protein
MQLRTLPFKVKEQTRQISDLRQLLRQLMETSAVRAVHVSHLALWTHTTHAYIVYIFSRMAFPFLSIYRHRAFAAKALALVDPAMVDPHAMAMAAERLRMCAGALFICRTERRSALTMRILNRTPRPRHMIRRKPHDTPRTRICLRRQARTIGILTPELHRVVNPRRLFHRLCTSTWLQIPPDHDGHIGPRQRQCRRRPGILRPLQPCPRLQHSRMISQQSWSPVVSAGRLHPCMRSLSWHELRVPHRPRLTLHQHTRRLCLSPLPMLERLPRTALAAVMHTVTLYHEPW